MLLVRNQMPSFGQLFDEMMQFAQTHAQENWNRPAANIATENEAYHLELLVPGFGKNDIELKVEKHDLHITVGGKKNKDADAENKETLKYNRKEWQIDGYKRSFELPEDVNRSEIKANCENGVLRIVLPKMQPKEEPVQLVTVE